MKKKLSFIIIFLLIIVVNTNAQESVISGKVLNKITSKPIPYSCVQIENTNIGTVTNNEGKFKLIIPYKYMNNNVSFSNIGYKVEFKKIKTLKPESVIFLQAEDEAIQEVIIMPDSTLLTLLRRAYIKIADNYSTKPINLKGFYRETLRTENDQYLYFAEAVLELFKASYQKKSNSDQVKIIKSMVNEFSGSDTVNNVRFYGGAFLASTLDVVKQRFDFINPQHFKRYNYSLDKITTFHNNEVYVVNFDTNNDSLKGSNKGKMYIDKESLAYVAFKFENTKRGIKQYQALNHTPYNLKERNYDVFYSKQNNKWYLKYIVYEREGYNNVFNSKLFNQAEFIRTEIRSDSVKPIPFNERLEYRDIFSLKANEYYSEDYWSDYSILQQDTILKNQIKPLYSTDETKNLLTFKPIPPKEKLILKIVKNLSCGFGLGFYPYSFTQTEYSASYNTGVEYLDLIENRSFSQHLYSFQLSYYYNVYNNWEIGFSGNSNLTKSEYLESYDIGISRRFLVSRRSFPVVLRISLLYSHNNLSKNFPLYENNSTFYFNNTKIDAEKLQFGTGNKITGFKPEICLEFNPKKQLWITTAFEYLYPVSSSDRLFLKEKSGFFLTRKKESIHLSDESIRFNIADQQNLTNPVKLSSYSFNIGLMIRF